MSSKKIEALKRQRQGVYRRKKSQVPYGLVLLAGVFAIAMAGEHYLGKGLYWMIGVLIGITLQRSRFCFAASFRDPILVGSTTLLRGVLLALMISTVGFHCIQAPFIQEGVYEISQLPGQIYPVGLHTVVGAILFGAAMVLAGGCASGTLVRIGEGYTLQLLVLLGFIIGAVLGGRHFEFWDQLFISKSPVIYLPAYLGRWQALVLQLLVLGIFYGVAVWYDKKHALMPVGSEGS